MKVGDYVRTKDGYIYKIEDGEEFYEDYVDVGIGTIPDVDGIWVDKSHFQYVDKREIIKSSPNIIDLIQEGDILKINDFKDVYTIYEVEMFRNPYTNEKYLGIRNDIGKRPKRLYEIPLVNLSIVTKEQFESMEYKVKEEIIWIMK